MRSLSLCGIALPVLALAACTDSNDPGAAVAPLAVIVAPSRGAAIAQQVCGQCHGVDFKGATIGSTACPSLASIQRYTLTEFRRLLFSGETRGGDDVRPHMMVNQAVEEADLSELLDYLKAHVDNP